MDEESFGAVRSVLESGQLAQGPKVEEFERNFADYTGTKYAVAVNSGTAALHTALLASGITRGDEVIVTSFSFIASANCCLYCNAVPVFCDIEPATFNLKPHLIEEKITPRTKAVIAVDLYGQPCDMDEIAGICRKNGLVLIEDACQATGAEYGGRKTGSFGIGCFSFYPTKNMTTGEGGMLTTDDENVARKAGSIRNHGQSQKYLHNITGYNFRMTDIVAAIGINQLKKLDKANQKRRENALYLSQHISEIKGLIPPFIARQRTHVFHQFTIRVTRDFKLSRDELQTKLNQQGIGNAIHYPIPIHKQPLYQDLGYDDCLPVSEAAAQEVLSLPVHPSLTNDDLKTIVRALQDA